MFFLRRRFPSVSCYSFHHNVSLTTFNDICYLYIRVIPASPRTPAIYPRFRRPVSSLLFPVFSSLRRFPNFRQIRAFPRAIISSVIGFPTDQLSPPRLANCFENYFEWTTLTTTLCHRLFIDLLITSVFRSYLLIYWVFSFSRANEVFKFQNFFLNNFLNNCLEYSGHFTESIGWQLID